MTNTVVVYNIGLFDMIDYDKRTVHIVYPCNCKTGCLTQILNNVVNVFNIDEEMINSPYYPLFLIQIHNPIKIYNQHANIHGKSYSDFLIQIDFYKYIYVGQFPIEIETSYEVTNFIMQPKSNSDYRFIPLARDLKYTYRLDMVEEDSNFMCYVKYSNDVFTLDKFNGQWFNNYIYLPCQKINVKMI